MYTCVAKDTGHCESRRSGTLTILNRGTYERYCGISVNDQVRKTQAVVYISTGQDASKNENPWHVSLFAKGETFCGGSLISQRFVVTAAHCITDLKKEDVRIAFGSLNCTAPADLIRGTKSITIHPRFNKTAFYDSDIALLELNEAVQYNDSVRPICVLDYYKIRRLMAIPRHPNGRVSGCGMLDEKGKKPNVLQHIVMPYTDRRICKEDLETIPNKNYTFTKNMFCAGQKKRLVGDVCRGDSGGGFMMELTGMFQWVLGGIVSFGFMCDGPEHYSYFTSAGKFYNWINGIAKFTDEKVNLDFLNE
ncbi:hypothetical protein DPMN_016814 [Dreissena polymorpha]|uniref:Peptidase S1 domain-containing protein n=1 Tax=Dreissena polymorpha TaxID=45954 RepID=A0A9D4NFA6_DREPO|nr:hypothetical protein DPMN_016814 [Dreissena polymorpha]